MRALAIGSLVLAACSPDIVSGSYLCGPEEACPEGFACDRDPRDVEVEAQGRPHGPVCVTPERAGAFACGTVYNDVAGDDQPATAQVLGDFDCVSIVNEQRGCMPEGDTGDFYTLRVADNCTNVRLKAAVIYPVAWQHLVLQLGKTGETPQTIETPCNFQAPPDDFNARSCLDAPVEPGTYVVGVIPDGTDNCDGACRFTRYAMSVQVTTP